MPPHSYKGPERRQENAYLSERLDTQDRVLIQIRDILTGNGDPKKGLVYKVQTLADFRDFCIKLFWVFVPIGAAGASSAIALFVFKLLKDQVTRGNI